MIKYTGVILQKIELCLETITKGLLKNCNSTFEHCIVSIPDVSVSVESRNCLPFNFSFRGALTEKFKGQQKSTEIKILSHQQSLSMVIN